MGFRIPWHDRGVTSLEHGFVGQHAYGCACSDTIILVDAKWDPNMLRCPYCAEKLVEPVIPDRALERPR